MNLILFYFASLVVTMNMPFPRLIQTQKKLILKESAILSQRNVMFPASVIQRSNVKRAISDIGKILKSKSMSQDKVLLKYFSQKEFADLVKNQDYAVQIYDEIRLHVNPGLQPEYLNRLKELAFNRDLPTYLYAASQVLAYRYSRPETIEFLIASPAFQRFSKDRAALHYLMKEMDKDGARGNQVWKKAMPALKEKLTENWALEILTNQDEFPILSLMEYLDNQENALHLYKKLKGSQVSPKILNAVRKGAYKSFLNILKSNYDLPTVLRVIRKLSDDDVLQLLQSSDSFKTIIRDPFKAFQLEKRVFKRPGQEEFFQELQGAANRDYLSTSEVIVTLISLNNARMNVITELESFPSYQRFISDSKRALDLVNIIETNPRIYAAIFSNEHAMKNLKMNAYRSFFPVPKMDATNLAKSYAILDNAGLTDEFLKSGVYLGYIRSSLDAAVKMYKELKMVFVPRDSKVMQDLELLILVQTLQPFMTKKTQVGHEFLENYIKDGGNARNLLAFIEKRVGDDVSIASKIRKRNPEFIERLVKSAA